MLARVDCPRGSRIAVAPATRCDHSAQPRAAPVANTAATRMSARSVGVSSPPAATAASAVVNAQVGASGRLTTLPPRSGASECGSVRNQRPRRAPNPASRGPNRRHGPPSFQEPSVSVQGNATSALTTSVISGSGISDTGAGAGVESANAEAGPAAGSTPERCGTPVAAGAGSGAIGATARTGTYVCTATAGGDST